MHEQDIVPPLGPPPKLTYAEPDDPWLRRTIINVIEQVCGRAYFDKLYHEVRDMRLPKNEIWPMVVRKVGLEIDYQQAQLDKIPKTGPVVVVANHPFGIPDGLALLYLVQRTRPDTFIMLNSVLAKEEQVEDFLIPVNFRKGQAAKDENFAAGARTIDRLQNGECFLVFPGGGVATAPHPFTTAPREFPWRRFIAKTIQDSEATVVPIFVHGRNTWPFHMASFIHSTLRLGLLIREFHLKLRKPVRLTIGDPMPFESFREDVRGDRQILIDHLYEVTMDLGVGASRSSAQTMDE